MTKKEMIGVTVFGIVLLIVGILTSIRTDRIIKSLEHYEVFCDTQGVCGFKD